MEVRTEYSLRDEGKELSFRDTSVNVILACLLLWLSTVRNLYLPQGHYHSQSPEAYLAHTPGLTVVMPRGPKAAKGLLLSSIRRRDPVIFLEPKSLYRTAVEEVPIGDYEIELEKAEIIRQGSDVTVVGWGAQLLRLEAACKLAEEQDGIRCELIDLQTILPWDIDTVEKSVQKTGKLVVSHEAPSRVDLGLK